MMRVIAGSARGRKLQTPEGMNTRPTTDRLKEALFGMIQFDIPGAQFLDLFAGSGGIGIEALSRGASHLDSVEQEARALRCIRANLKTLNMEAVSRVWAMPAEQAIRQMAAQGRQFDIIFMDPPYRKGWEEKIVSLISEYRLLKPDGYLIVESSSETQIHSESMELIKEKVYKTTRFSFFRPAQA